MVGRPVLKWMVMVWHGQDRLLHRGRFYENETVGGVASCIEMDGDGVAWSG